MMFYKNARVEYHPVGVMGAIVPWNYPFHNGASHSRHRLVFVPRRIFSCRSFAPFGRSV